MTRILVVDDKEDGLYYLSSLLSAHGFEIDAARHGAEALARARQTRPDVVVSDLLMPVMDGFTLLRHWKMDERLKRAPFIVYTATYTDVEDEQLALELGADAFILKPSEPDDFLDRIREILARSSTSSPRESPVTDQGEGLLREYSAILIRKLEEKMLQLEASNRTLQEDIRARQRAEAARDEAQRQASERAALLDALFASVPDVVLHLDLDGNVRMINRTSALFPQIPAHGTAWFECGPAAQRPMMREAFEQVIASGQLRSFEMHVGAALGGSTYWFTIAPVVREQHITGAVVVVRDISLRKQTEAQLIVSDRMASVGSMAASVAHEINNPLLCVTANLALISQELDTLAGDRAPSAELLEALRDARDGAERVRVIVRDLKIFSRAEDLKRGPVDVEQVLESTLRMAWNELRHRARVIKHFGRVPAVDSNEARLGQVFLNLVVNAAQAIGEGNYERNEVRIETSVDADPHWVVVTVADTGAGMTPELQARVFSPFVTTKPEGVGTGLGLSICHRILTHLGGRIDFSSEPGKGTSFRVFLPIADRPSSRPPAPIKHSGAAASQRANLLLVDDDDLVAQVVRRALAHEHDIRIVNSAEAAFALFRAGERFDIVLCDLMMPQITGMELYRMLHELDAEQAARVVFMTGGAFTPSARMFLDGVPNRRLEKPFELRSLRELIRQLLS